VFSLPIMIFVMAIMTIVQISIWQMFPIKVRDVLFANPVVAFIINLMGSGLIVGFTGIASFVGICNLGASVLFGVYAYSYGRRKGITGLGVGWYKLWNFVPVFPRPMVCYEKNGRTWMA